MITLLDYGAGNVRSVVNALEYIGEKVKIVNSPDDILSAEKLVFPGVGSFGNMIKILNEKNYVDPLRDYLNENKQFLGICLGLHALFEKSEESNEIYEGLGFIKGSVTKFNVDHSVPQIGWNGVNIKKKSGFFSNFRGQEKFYFVHSYHVNPIDDKDVLTTTNYGYEYTSSIEKGNVIATQFHPEKSGENGLKLLKNFVEQKESNIPEISTDKTRIAKRIIACLDVRSNDNGDLVVTKGDQYDVREEGDVRNLGKPVELAERYYKEGSDEITFLNITGFRDFPLEDMPMIDVLKKTSANVFVPLTIGGGIRDFTDKNGKKYTALEVASEYFRSGADKISIGSDAVLIVEEYLKTGIKTGKSSIEVISKVYGNQAVVISVDPKRVYVKEKNETAHVVIKTDQKGPSGEEYCWYQCTIKGGREGRELDAITFSKACEELGAGEILLNCIDKDGTNSGFDCELISAVRNVVTIPVIASSGAGSVEHFAEVFEKTDAEAALAAGIFHRREVPVEAVKDHLKDKVEIRTKS
ncbi:MAG: imidazole glycerol phosphate synthase subunit HisF [Desulfobacterales bacterium]|nr:imidazole glycerol phosphate synthase subunit HisF [Desulfobacterales bacterium]MCP4162496.1 imidazole glycerol phosphate synthase subunit HisF [Deltaproteobacteria bacterium]